MAANDPLYNGAPITVSASYLMLFLFAKKYPKKYQLTVVGFQALFELVKNPLGTPDNITDVPKVFIN